MAPIVSQKNSKQILASTAASAEIEGEIIISPRSIIVSCALEGEGIGVDCLFLAILTGKIILEEKWQDAIVLENNQIPLDMKDSTTASVIADTPLVLLMRAINAKGSKETDPLLHPDNRAGANVDLLPLLLGEERVETRVNLVYLSTGEYTECFVEVCINAGPGEDSRIPLLLTMLSVHCLPPVKEGTVYVSAVGLDGLVEPAAVTFGMSSVVASGKRSIWGSISALGYAAESDYDLPNEDMYIPLELHVKGGENCIFDNWNICKRILVDETILSIKLDFPFFIETAGVPKTGKIEIRGRYMGYVDAAVLLEPGETGVTTCAKLNFFNEAVLPENIAPLLELPPSSAKTTARETDDLIDEFGHMAYIILRFDVIEPLVPKVKVASLYDFIGLKTLEGQLLPVDVLYVKPPPEDNTIDVNKIRKESGALAVHLELSNMACCTGTSVMNQTNKKTAANKLLIRVKSMIKQFSPDTFSNNSIDWQDIVMAQHSAARHAVTSSFAPQPPPFYMPTHLGAARSRIVGDTRVANILTVTSLNIAPNHPKSLLVKALRCLEQYADKEAYDYLQDGLNLQPTNKYLLWAFASQEFNKNPYGIIRAVAGLRIATKNNNNDGTCNAISWAALHALYHNINKPYAAFVAARKMRKAYELPRDWKGFLQRYIDVSGEEECLWDPSCVDTSSPLTVAAAFFLCLRAYKFTELLLNCCVNHCVNRGAHNVIQSKQGPEVSYLRSASLLLRGQIDRALKETTKAITLYGPHAKLLQMRAMCLLCLSGWDSICEGAIRESEKAGANPSPALLLSAALGGMTTNPQLALQRAARAHKIAPCAHSALIVGRIFFHLGDDVLAKRWASAAVKQEPNLSDGWAFLACLAIRNRNVDKARSLLRTANQVGPISSDIIQELNYLMGLIPTETLPDSLMKDLCLCEFY